MPPGPCKISGLGLFVLVHWLALAGALNAGEASLSAETLREAGPTRGVIERIAEDEAGGWSHATVRLLSGPYRDRVVEARIRKDMEEILGAGERCLVVVSEGSPGVYEAEVAGPMLEGVILAFAALALAITVLTLRRKGLGSLAATGFALALVFGVVLPLSMRGWSPLGLGAGAGVLVCVVGIMLINGVKRASFYAIVGSLSAMAVAMWLPLAASKALALTGLEVSLGTIFNAETVLWYSEYLARVDFAQLLVAGMILAGLGATMDIAVTVASAIQEAARSPEVSRGRLLLAGLRVGKGVFPVMVLTVGLAAVGTALDKYLLYCVAGNLGAWTRLLDWEGTAAAAITIASAAVGMGLTVPLTALAGALAEGKGRRRPTGSEVRVGRAPRAGKLAWALVAVSIGAVLAACQWAWLSTLRQYDEQPVHEAETVDRGRFEEQELLARVVGVGGEIEDVFDVPIMENAERGSALIRRQPLALEVLTGKERGRLMMVNQGLKFNPAQNATVREGTIVKAYATLGDEADAWISRPIVRSSWVLWCMGAVVAGSMVVFGVAGVRLAVGLAIAGLGLWHVLFALVLRGVSPVAAGLAYVCVLGIATLVMMGRKGSGLPAALLGAGAGILGGVAGTLAAARWMHLSGIASTDAYYLRQALAGGLDFAGLALAGMIVFVTAAAFDVAVSVSAAVYEVGRAGGAGTRRGTRDAIRAGLRMGGNITGTEILTLVFVWAGVKLPALMLPLAKGTPFRVLVNGEPLGVAALHLLGACLTLAITGPVTAVIAGTLFHGRGGRAPKREKARSRGALAEAVAVGCVVLAIVAWAVGKEVGRRRASRRIERSELEQLMESGSFEGLYGYAVRHATGEGPRRYNDAGIALWTALGINPENGEARRLLAEVYLAKGWKVLALDQAGQAMEILGEDSDSCRIAGEAFLELGMREEAREWLERSVAADSENERARQELEQLTGPGM